MSIREFLSNLFEDRLTWGFGALLGLAVALADLQSATRWPFVVSVCIVALALSLLAPKWPWRWTLLTSLVLPVYVAITNTWGPYEYDRFDVFYGMLPATLGTFTGAGLRTAWLRIRRK
jgi:hypothetical protein